MASRLRSGLWTGAESPVFWAKSFNEERAGRRIRPAVLTCAPHDTLPRRELARNPTGLLRRGRLARSDAGQPVQAAGAAAAGGVVPDRHPTAGGPGRRHV